MSTVIKYFINTILVIVIFSSELNAQGIAESESLAQWTSEGMVIFVSSSALSPENPVDGRVASVIYRQLEGESSYREVARLGRADNMNEFIERGGTRLRDALLHITGAESDDELWEYIRENPDSEDYGLLLFERDFQKAFGMIYIDRETSALAPGEEVSYRVVYEMANGEDSDFGYQGAAVAGVEPNLLAPEGVSVIESESLIGVSWQTPIEGSEDAAFANIYRQKGLDGDFERLPERVLAARNIEEGIINYSWRENTEPEVWHRFYIEPIDMVGNTGPRSDTLQVISVNFDNIPLMSNVEVADTSAGIYLSWEPIPFKPYITGIEIKRSRNASRNFVIMDTLSVFDTEFLDTRVVPNLTYYYEFRVVTVRESDDLPSAIANGSFVNTEMPPPQPSGLFASQEGEHIRLEWNSVQEADLYAYYVYRGTSRHDSLVVASRAITDSTTFLDTNENLDGRTNYTYAIKAVNMSGMESELSEFVVIRPNRKVQPLAPIGVSGYAENNRVRINWRDVQRRDEAVAGYHVYRSSQPVENVSFDNLPENVERLTPEFITTTAFDDMDVISGQRYYYAVSSVDIFDEESALSPFAGFTTSLPELLAPAQVSVRSINGQIELRWSQTQQTGAAGYTIYRRTRDETEPTVLANLSVDETTFSDISATPGTLYWYSITIVTEDDESVRSQEQSVVIR